MDLTKAISARRSIREFSNKSVHWDKVLEAIDAANQAPFAGNINNLKFVIVSEKEMINKIAEHCQQDWIADAKHIAVVCSTLKEIELQYNDRGKIYSRQQAGAAIQNFLLKITEMKLAACWIGAFSDESIKSDLRIPEEYSIEAVIPIGHPKNKSPKKIRKASLESRIFWGRWKIDEKPMLYKDPEA